MTPRYRVSVAGMPSAGLVRWLQELVPVLQHAPAGVFVTVTIEEAEDGRSDHAAGDG